MITWAVCWYAVNIVKALDTKKHENVKFAGLGCLLFFTAAADAVSFVALAIAAYLAWA